MIPKVQAKKDVQWINNLKRKKNLNWEEEIILEDLYPGICSTGNLDHWRGRSSVWKCYKLKCLQGQAVNLSVWSMQILDNRELLAQ